MSRGGGPGATTLSGWGRTAPSRATLRPVRSPEDVTAAVLGAREGRGLLARGLGRSYGDAAQNAGGLVLDLTALDRVHAVDAGSGAVEVDAGVSLDTLIPLLLRRGLWLPVLPGTRHVTVGGAVAADVHGKNHHADGSFGDHLLSLDLVTADGSLRTLGPDEPAAADRALWAATVGGMGLTGVVTRATLRCRRVASSSMVVTTERASDLDDLLDKLGSADDEPYSVAWFDAVTRGRRTGRAVITRARHATLDDLPLADRADAHAHAPRVRARVPDTLPPGLLNRLSARAFNELYFRAAPRRPRTDLQDVSTFFHPLDVLSNWNRLYGSRGLVQYQLAVPLGREEALRDVVRAITGSGHVSCLNVLKRLGPGADRPLSFPQEGWTLAVDLPARPGLSRLLRGLDETVAAAGGRIYLAKDSRARAATVAAMYPRLEDFRAVRRRVDPDGVFASDLSRRLEL